MDDSYRMKSGIFSGHGLNDLLFLILTAAVAGAASFAVFMACFYWFRREQRRMQQRILNAINQAVQGTDGVFVMGGDVPTQGELVAQFKVNQGRQVVSVLEAGGKRFIHIDGELSAPERAQMVRYLKSEGFMS